MASIGRKNQGFRSNQPPRGTFVHEERMSRTDIELMLEFQQDGTPEAFEALVARYQRPLINFFFRLLWRKDVAEDLAQEVFCRVFRHRLAYEARAKFSTYLFRIARNLWIDYCRRRQAAPRTVPLSPRGGDGSHSSGGLAVAARTPSVTERLDRQELIGQVQEAIEDLPDDQRMVLVLSKTKGLKYAEIAEVLEIPVGTVRSRLHAAISKLRERLVSHSAAGRGEE